MKAIKTHFYIALLLALLVWAGWRPPTAQAHANLVQSDPQAGETLAKSPPTIALEFSEGLDPHFSKVRLVDGGFQTVVAGPGTINPGQPRRMTLDLPALPDGVYAVIWQARSATDGHITSGAISFSVGKTRPLVSLLPAPGAPTPATAFPPLAETILRWLGYLTAALGAGSIAFGLLVWRPAFRQSHDAGHTNNAGYTSNANPADDLLARRTLRRLALAGVLGFGLATLGLAASQAWQSSQGAFQLAFGTAFWQLVNPTANPLFWIRLLLLIALGLFILRLSNPGSGSARPWIAAAVLALGSLLTISLQSHAAALGSPLAITLDWIHLAAMCAWLGGLLPLFLLMRSTSLTPTLLVPRFSRLALVCVAALALTGIYSAYIHVGTLDALTQTTYGWALIVKVGFFGLLVMLGAVNLLALSPRLANESSSAARWLKLTVRVELVAGLFVLLAAGLLASAAPALEALQAQHRLGYIGDYQEKGVQFSLWVAPARAGYNEMAVDISRLPPGVDPTQIQVQIRLLMPDQDMGITQVMAAPQGQGRYVAQGSYLSMSGRWEMEVTVRRPGADDVTHVFLIQVQPGP